MELAAVAAMSLIVGVGLTAVSIYLCLHSVDGRQIDLQKPDLVIDGPDGVGPLPEVGRLHVRDGIFWEVASDRLPGVWWVHVERIGQPSINPDLTIESIPRWAEAPETFVASDGAVVETDGPAPQAQTVAFGTLALGWPWLAIAQRWAEGDRTTGFIPTLENDDDGSTTARAAGRFGTTTAAGRPFLLWSGFVADTLLFAGLVAPLFVLLRRRSRASGTA